MIEVYHFVNNQEQELSFTTMDPKEARAFAQQYGYLMVAHKYEFSESEPVEDFRGKGEV